MDNFSNSKLREVLRQLDPKKLENRFITKYNVLMRDIQAEKVAYVMITCRIDKRERGVF